MYLYRNTMYFYRKQLIFVVTAKVSFLTTSSQEYVKYNNIILRK